MDNLELTGTRPPSVASSRPSSRQSNRPRSGYHMIAEKSNVDELLFSSHHPRHEDIIGFKAPWDETPRHKTERDRPKKPRGPPLFWSPDTREENLSSSQSDRGSVLRKSNITDKLNRYRPKKYTASYCDETLFGPKLEEPSFEAPWAEKVRKPRPHLFSPIDYAKLTRDNSSLATKNRYSSAGTLDGRPPSRQGRRPASSDSRPITVESCQNIEKPIWKP